MGVSLLSKGGAEFKDGPASDRESPVSRRRGVLESCSWKEECVR